MWTRNRPGDPTVGRFLKTARKNKVLTQQIVAEWLGYSPAQLSDIENGKSGAGQHFIDSYFQLGIITESEHANLMGKIQPRK